MAGSTFTGPLKIRKSDNTKVTFVDEDGNLSVGASIAMSDGDSIKDDNGNELLKAAVVSSAVNEVTIGNAATGNNPVLKSTGDDTNIGLDISSKGTGGVTIWTGDKAREGLKIVNTASAVNEVTITPAVAGGQPTIAPSGDDTNINLLLSGKGTGVARFNASSGTATGTGGTSTVTINAQMGTITTDAITTAAGATHVITLTNSAINTSSRMFATANASGSAGMPVVTSVVPASGSATITIQNIHASSAFNAAIKVYYIAF